MIYVDTGFLIGLLDRRDAHFDLANELHERYFYAGREIFLTTRAVVNEMLAHFSRLGSVMRTNAASLAEGILDGGRWRVVTVDDALYRRALRRYKNRPDKRYSMVDCIGMTVMDEEGVREVLATDVDFEQEQFVNLMRLAK